MRIFKFILGGQMYAIIETGGKQYRVEKGDTIDVELLDIEDNIVKFKNVLLKIESFLLIK